MKKHSLAIDRQYYRKLAIVYAANYYLITVLMLLIQLIVAHEFDRLSLVVRQ